MELDLKAFIIRASLSGAQSPVVTYHLSVADTADDAVRYVQEELALFDDSVSLMDELPAAEAESARVDIGSRGYKRRWTLASRGER